jgi:hypothetical protein
MQSPSARRCCCCAAPASVTRSVATASLAHGVPGDATRATAQDAVTDATNIGTSEAEVDGVKFYRYDVESPVSWSVRVCVFV